MKTLIAMLVTTTMLAGLSAPVGAATKHKKKYARSQAYSAKNSANDYG